MTKILYDYQERDAKNLLTTIKARGAALDGGDTGVGKTYTALGIAQQLDLPTLAVVPMISISDWSRAADHIGVELDILNWEMIRTGRTPYGWWQHPRTEENARYRCQNCLEEVETKGTGYRCQNCLEEVELAYPGCRCQNCLKEVELIYLGCRCSKDGEHVLEKIKKHNYGKFTWHPSIRFLIFDEVHRANAIKSLNSEMLVAAKRQGIPTLALSATPAASPLQFRGLGYLLGMHQLTGPAGFYAWSKGLRCGRHPQFKQWMWLAGKAEQNKIMTQLNRLIFPAFGVRTRTEDIPGFPDRRIQANLFDLEGFKKIDELYEEMKEAMDRLRERKAKDQDPENPLVKLLRCRQEVELLKVPPVVELTQDYLAKGYAVAVFINFSETMRELRWRLKCDCFIDGTQTGSPAKRQEHLDAFQANRERVIIVNSQAGGECCNLQDIHGDHPCVGLVMPPASARIFKQLAGRLHRQGGKSLALYRVIFAANTREVEIHKKLSHNLNNIDALMDSDMVPDNLTDFI